MNEAQTRKAGPGKRSRRDGRVLAIQILYAFEQKHYDDDERLLVDDEVESDPDARDFARTLFAGFNAERQAVDAVVDASLKNWTLGRLAVPDRCILRLGCFELLYCADTPPKVAINEYIEIAKLFGSEGKSAKLVNGVLDRIAREHRGDEVARNKKEASEEA